MDFLINNWQYFLLGLFIAEKIVKLTPCKWDDIVIDSIKAGLLKVTGKGQDEG